jgi:hypothetical protein
MSDAGADLPPSTPAPPVPAAVLEYRRVEPIAREVSDRARRNAIGGFATFVLFIAFIAMLCQWSYPQEQHTHDLNQWCAGEPQRRFYERDVRKGIASGPPPAAPTPVVVHPWASALMTAGDAILLYLALFAHRLVRRLNPLRRPPLLSPGRIWRAMLTLAVAQLLLSLACVGLDAWRIFTFDFLFVGWILVGLIVAEVLTRFAAGMSFPEALQRFNFVKNRDEITMRR